MASEQLVAPKIDEQTISPLKFELRGVGNWIRPTQSDPTARFVSGQFLEIYVLADINPLIKHRVRIEFEVSKTENNFGWDRVFDVTMWAKLRIGGVPPEVSVKDQIAAMVPGVKTMVHATFDVDANTVEPVDQLFFCLKSDFMSSQFGGLNIHSATVKNA